MSENIAATLRNLVYNGADEATMHKAMLEAAGALDDMAAEYEAKIQTMGENAYGIWKCLVHALNDMQKIADEYMLCDHCEYLSDEGTCSNPGIDAEHCWTWRGFREVLKRENT